MKVRLMLDIDDHTRYVIAKYYRAAIISSDAPRGDRTRTRATRAQARRFVVAALRRCVINQARDLDARSRAVAKRLLGPEAVSAETLPAWGEAQPALPGIDVLAS